MKKEGKIVRTLEILYLINKYIDESKVVCKDCDGYLNLVDANLD
ncbi:hypothetical protein [uncultured Clostridium sp.]|nr:hypothetical protein [uncultured Clostridium sp.]